MDERADALRPVLVSSGGYLLRGSGVAVAAPVSVWSGSSGDGRLHRCSTSGSSDGGNPYGWIFRYTGCERFVC